MFPPFVIPALSYPFPSVLSTPQASAIVLPLLPERISPVLLLMVETWMIHNVLFQCKGPGFFLWRSIFLRETVVSPEAEHKIAQVQQYLSRGHIAGGHQANRKHGRKQYIKDAKKQKGENVQFHMRIVGPHADA